MSTTDKNMRFNTYAPGNKFDKFYVNSKNNIEDPIFTGFTFDIDTLNSPLFFSLCGYEYDESLRSKNGTNRELSDKIEEKLENAYKYHISGAPESYEINTVYTKDDIGDNHKAGYGLQERYYMDKPIYGAVDYIYMVDKTSVGMYVDEAGVTDLGNGTNKNFYRDSLKALNTNRLSNNVDEQLAYINTCLDRQIETMTVPEYNPETGEWEGGEMRDYDEVSDEVARENAENTLKTKKTDIQNQMNSQKVQNEHNVNKTSFDEIEKKYKDISDDIIGTKTKSLQEIDDNIQAAKIELNTKFSQIQADANTYLSKLLKGNDITTATTKASDLFYSFCDYFEISEADYDFIGPLPAGQENKMNVIEDVSGVINFIKNNKTISIQLPKNKSSKVKYDVKFSIPTNLENIDDEIEQQIEVVSVDEEAKEQEVKNYFNNNRTALEKLYFLTRVQISNQTQNKDVDKQRSELQAAIENGNEALYGVGGTQANPAPDSIYKQYKDAKDKYENDEYSQLQNQLAGYDNIEENFDDILTYEKNVASGTDYMANTVTPAFDTTKEENRNTRDIYEVPQTVYDMMGFINGMLDITNKYPYTLQSISGLDEAYKKYFEVKDPYMGSGDDKITIECLDYLDLKVSSMFNKYFNAVYDRQYRRERVPINLRRFNCSIFVHDIRNFKNSLNGGEYPGGGDLRPIVEMALNYVSAIEFKFYDCEFVPEETGGIFDSVSNVNFGDPVKTKFTFTYGNCVINFLPFEDLRKYLLNTDTVEPAVTTEGINAEQFDEDSKNVVGNNTVIKNVSEISNIEDGNFRRWFDRSELGNVNNNDYRDYVRNDASTVVDDYYKTTIVNNFALNSVVNKNKQLTEMDDALRKIVVGISASTGIPVKGVTSALNLGFIDPILNERDLATPVVKSIGNVNNSRVIDENTMEYIGEAYDKPEVKTEFIDFLGNVNDDKKEKGGK